MENLKQQKLAQIQTERDRIMTEKAKIEAQANLNTITNMVQNSGKSWDEIGVSTQMNLSKLESQAGLPGGLIKDFIAAFPKTKIIAQNLVTDENGDQAISFVQQDAKGHFSVVKVATGGKLSKFERESQMLDIEGKKAQIAATQRSNRGGGGGGGGGSDIFKDRLLTLAESKEYNVPVGTKLSDMVGKSLGQQPTEQGQSFDQYLAQEEEKAGMSFAPAKRAQLQQQFEAQNQIEQPMNEEVKKYVEKGYDIVDDTYKNSIKLSDGTRIQKLKPLTDTSTGKLSQFIDVVSQIEGIKKYAQDAGFFDPITGTFRDINPYDSKAQQLNRMITAVVPSLARGVFGEVGVLTDRDVERYTKLLPNVKAPKNQVEEALNFITKRIDTSYNNYLDTYKKSGYDVRDFKKAGEQNQSDNQSQSATTDLSKYIR